MKWVRYWSCFLLVEARLQWVLFSKVCLGWFLKLGSRSMTLSLREKVVRMIISLDCKSASLKAVLQNLLIVCVSYLHVLVSVLCVFQLSCARSFPVQNWSYSQTQQEKVEQKSFLDSSVGNLPKNQSKSLLATSPLWETSLSFHAFWDSILAPVQDDK